MKTINIAFLLLFLLPRVAYSYDPPEVFAVFTGEDQTRPFANDFCWIEDQNGDGCDELLINNPPYNQVWFYWGGDNMDDNVDVIFRTDIYDFGLGREVVFHGNVIPDQVPLITIGTTLGIDDQAHGSLYVYEAGEEIDNDVDLILTTEDNDDSYGLHINSGRRTRPADLNGDGYHDIIVSEWIRDRNSPLLVYFGGEDFDTIPDWSVTCPQWMSVLDIKSGFDINGDGYDDIFVQAHIENATFHYFAFLGGDPMDTTSAFDFGVEGFECEAGPAFIGPPIMLQDVNDDGYDDWAAGFSDPGRPEDDDYNGKFVFFGGEEPDLEPDLELEGIHHGWIFGDAGSMTGGDFNGDGIGDIMLGASDRAISDYGEVCIYFGSRWMDGGEPDIMIRNRDDAYEDFPNLGCSAGASGDYNGDGVDDIVVKSQGGREGIFQLVILLGNEDWVVGVDEPDLPEEYKLSLEATPNPFNNSVTISYEVPVSGSVRLSVYDVQGRLVEQLENIDKSRDEYNVTWNCSNSGIYLLLMQAGDEQMVKKVVCIK